ncbi:Tetratricopeptide repeat-containing protein [Saccharicrinis carchari]|uniref:Tetratricopeptide repeat-containing protein n=1 Tax=Saccharicrinis carchari TaxID=1168039 RepID=A0A521E8R2_SACCC|nr:histidine kinase [Saccharicrinis carchari]SMO80299.1 Tetratricopeptide repeat-containing protein [Saccharicrinis carchari]
MRTVAIKTLFITYLCLCTLPSLVLSGNNPASNIANEIPDSAQTVLNQRISDAKNDSIKRMEAYYDFGEYLEEVGEYEKSIEQFTAALRIAQSIHRDDKVATMANYLANIYAGTGDFKASNDTYLVALKSAEKIKDSGEIAKISMNLASNYNYTGDYNKAVKYGLYALKTKETTNNLTRICYHYIAMGNIFRENNNTVKWEEYVEKAYKMKDREGCASFGDLAKIYNSLGGIAVAKNELEKGLLYYDTLLTLSKEAGYYLGISSALSNSAGVYKQLGNYEKALTMATEAENYFSGNPYEILFSNNFKAELYQIKGQFAKGLELAKANIHIEDINNYSTEKLKSLQLLYELNFNLKNYDAAFFWNDSLRTAESRLRDEDIRQSFEDLEAKYETEKKEQKIELLSAENKLKNQRINAGLGVVGALIIVILLIIYISHIHKKQAELKQNILQQQVLRAQMNPHFIFNVLGSIQNFMLQNDTRKASNFLSLFSSLTRATLNNSAAETISLSNEISMLKNYIELEQMRKGNKFDYEINFDQNLETDFIQIPPMLIQPFIENSIKHGLETIEYRGMLQVHFYDERRKIRIEITDNGIGIKKAALLKKGGHNSKAMQIFEERRRLFAKKTKQHIDFTINDRSDQNPNEQGTQVEIQIPIDINY